MFKMIRLVALDVFKNRTIIVYTLLLACLSWSVFSLEDNSTKAVLTLLNLMLLTIPLVSIIFSSIYIYNSAEFIDLLVSQPISRKTIWISLYSGAMGALTCSFLIGIGIPVFLFLPLTQSLFLIGTGLGVTLTFSSFGFLSSVWVRDKAKGIGLSIILWLFFVLLFDGVILLLLFQLSDYPVEDFMVFITLLNPIDLARILVLLQLNVSAMLGYTGAVFKEFFGTTLGTGVAIVSLFIWVVIPFYLSLIIFNKRDL